MKYLIPLLCLFFVPLSAEAQQPERKVIKPPVKSVPRDFTRPQPQRPSGFGKQQWQRPQQSQVRSILQQSLFEKNLYNI